METKQTTQYNRETSENKTSAIQSRPQVQPVDDITEYVKAYAQQNPGTAALWCFGIGFVVGWKLKPW